MLILGYRMLNGIGMPPKPHKGIDLLMQAAEAGNRMSMHNLAALYAGGALGTMAVGACTNSTALWRSSRRAVSAST